jgi:DDE family transposase
MPTRRGFIQGYNAQVAVSSDHLIAAVRIGQSPNDMSSFVPMMNAAVDAAATLHQSTALPQHQIVVILADAGYCSDRNLAAPGPERLIALSKTRDHAATAQRDPVTGPPPPDASPRQAMDHRLRTPEGARLYKRRAATVEPSIGNLKAILPRFSRRGLDAAASELKLAATAINLMKIHRAETA